MNTLTKSILVICLFGVMTFFLLLISGNMTGQMDNRWSMVVYSLRDTTWLIVPFAVTMGMGLVVWWLVHRSRRLHS